MLLRPLNAAIDFVALTARLEDAPFHNRVVVRWSEYFSGLLEEKRTHSPSYNRVHQGSDLRPSKALFSSSGKDGSWGRKNSFSSWEVIFLPKILLKRLRIPGCAIMACRESAPSSSSIFSTVDSQTAT